VEQGTKEWLEMRRNYIGASDAPVIMSVSPYKTPFELWQEKVGLRSSESDNPATRYGKAMEEPARIAYERYTNTEVRPEIVYHPENDFMMASLDGLAYDSDTIVEIKNPNQDDHELAKKGLVPDKYYPQLQHQLDCLPGSILHYWSFRKGEGVLVEVVRDEDYIKELIALERDFWGKVKGCEAPELSCKDIKSLKIDEELMTLIAERRSLEMEKKAFKAREEENKRRLIERSGGSSVEGWSLRMLKYFDKGRVNYSKIPELDGVDLEAYRGMPIEKWRISIKDEEI
jgi:putative phage-type endonuclease